jgi:pimeloyl-ACP methyl ester carboxylesterase
MRVFLIHGMGRTKASMFLLGRRLRVMGHAPESFGYRVAKDPMQSIAEQFLARIRTVLEQDMQADPTLVAPIPYAVVGHSLGNIVTRLLTPRLPEGFARFVMLAPPNRSPVLARTLQRNPLFRLLTQDAGQKLADPDFYAALPMPHIPTLVMAGNAGPRANWLPFGGDHNDGVVAVDEARIDGVYFKELPALHTFIMNSGEVTQAILDFLQQGQLPEADIKPPILLNAHTS